MATGTLPGWLRRVNRVIQAFSALGLRVGPVHVLTVAGRRSGKPRPTPVSPLTVDGRRYIVAGLAQGDWARNVRATGEGDLAHGRRHHRVRLTQVDDPAERQAVMRAFPTRSPAG
jgi:deazaflavin-dependent oxidoreductase (nitroreductase family)